MKKYTITDNQGNKKTVYAKDLAHALTFVDSKAKDAVSLIKGDWFTLRRENDILYKVIDDQRKTINGFREAMMVEVYRITFTKDYKEYIIKKVGNESFHPDRWSSSDIIRFNSVEEAMNWLKRQLQLTKHRFDSKVKDEANLPTTIQALVNDEEAAIKAYEVAIKNLEGKIDETQMQVLINIMKDERRHVENLYAILNGQVTEKNLEDSIHDAFIVKADNAYIMEGDRPEMTSFKKYAKVFSSKQEAIDYARKYFKLRPIDIEIIEE